MSEPDAVRPQHPLQGDDSNQSGSVESAPSDTADKSIAAASIPTSHKMSILGLAPWILLAMVLLGTIFLRVSLQQSDHALANVVTAGMLTLAWILACVACLSSRRLRAFTVFLAVAPFVAIAGLLVFYKYERLDSELIPHFRARWQGPIELPMADVSWDAPDEIFAARASDFPQYLGPTRDGKVDVAINSDWQQDAPVIVWKQPIGEGWSGFAIQGDVAVTMEQRNEQEWVSAYLIPTGELVWKYEINAKHTTVPGGTGPRSTPSISGGRVFACSAVSQVVCLDLTDGVALWTQDLLELAGTDQAEFEAAVTWGRAGSPLVFDGRVVLPFGGPAGAPETLIAFDAQTGQELWRAGQGQISYSSPILASVDGDEQILLVSEMKVAGYAPVDGRLLWEVPWPGHSDGDPAISQPVIVDYSKLLLGKGYGQGSMLIEVTQQDGAWKAETLWRKKSIMKTKFTTAVIRNGYAYGLSDGILECIDVFSGERQWKRGRYRHGQLLMVQDQLIIVSEDGDLVLVRADPEEFQELAVVPAIGVASWNTLALSGNRLLIRNANEAACILLPVEEAQVAPDLEPVAPNHQTQTPPLPIP